MYLGWFQYASSILWRTPKAGIILIFPSAKSSTNDGSFFGRLLSLLLHTALHGPARPCTLPVVCEPPEGELFTILGQTLQRLQPDERNVECKDSRLCFFIISCQHSDSQSPQDCSLSGNYHPSSIISYLSFSTWELTTVTNGDMFPGSGTGLPQIGPWCGPRHDLQSETKPKYTPRNLDQLWSVMVSLQNIDPTKKSPNMHQFHPCFFHLGVLELLQIIYSKYIQQKSTKPHAPWGDAVAFAFGDFLRPQRGLVENPKTCDSKWGFWDSQNEHLFQCFQLT